MMQSYKVFVFLCSTMLAFAEPCLAADDGAKIVAEVCSTCHTAKMRPLDKLRLNRDEWREAVERMIGYGAEVPKEKMPGLLDYLARTFGPNGAATDASKK
jgi:cytochrome c5